MKSILVNEKYLGYCVFCGKPTETEHHLVFGRGLRNLADQDGLTVPCCDTCHTLGKNRIHDNSIAEKLSKMLGQLAFEKHYIELRGCDSEQARDTFRKRYGRSYL